MTQTKLSNLVNPEVMADMISANLPKKIKFAPVARVDRTLVNQPGDTITIPRFEYIGEAEDVAEGVAIGTTVLTTSRQSAKVKKAGKAIEITDESALSGHGDPVSESEDQLEKSIADKVDSDCVAALETATLEFVTGLKISYDTIVDAIDQFGEEDDEVKILFIHPNQKSTLRKDSQYLGNVPDAFMKGVVGEIAGAQVVTSSKVPFNAETNTYTNFIVKEGALAIYLKRDVEIETDRDILKKTTVLAADQHYVTALENESKVVKLVVGK
ncbi:N4-gp56 family major capsid protein [Psychrobacillus sp. BM2]|uniref:N4-gp56 family major capsid protein n=1 Tax=Psychrobacillus sp. BM2 TaxID=3400421 RepID=UPI003B02705C